ncbi:MAG: hypothetical protein JKY56_21765, partial [Kofleriaceae bacterium]|nr:hypothetical protein [Kofleriaceae bacterium]
MPLSFLVGLSACSTKLENFTCSESSDCSDNGRAAQCEDDGYCSFVDESCETGFRYGQASGQVSGMCTRDLLPIDAGAEDANIDGGQIHDPTVLGMSAGRKHTCVLLDNGETKCWGDNRLGQLDGIPTNSVGGGYNTRESTIDFPSGMSSGAGSTCVFSD